MSYLITKTDGTTITTVADGQIDQASTSLTLVGKNFSGFGQYLNENFISLLENFASAGNSPMSPLAGQLWYDTSENRIKVYSGTEWKAVGTSASSASRPLDISSGDFWYNTSSNQLYFFTGTADVLVGPAYNSSQGQSGFRIESIEDSSRVFRTVATLYLGNTVYGYYTSTEFTPRNQIPNFKKFDGTVATALKPGFNPINNDFKWQGTAINADKMGNIDYNFYARKNQASTFTESITVQNNTGFRFGDGPQGQIGVEGFGDIFFRNVANNKRILFKATKDSTQISVLEITPNNAAVSGTPDTFDILPGNPSSISRIGGNLEITGNLDVKGVTTTVESNTVKVTDKNIELGVTLTPTNTTADGGGIILKGDTDKTILFDNATTSWIMNQNINVTGTSRSVSINGDILISDIGGGFYSLGAKVTTAPGLNNFGAQISATIDNVTINNNRIANNGRTGTYSNGDAAVPTNLILEPLGNVVIDGTTSTKVTGVHNTNEDSVGGRQTLESSVLLSSTELTEATSKKYVTNFVRHRSIALTMDITGKSLGAYPNAETVLTSNEIATYLTQIAPVAEYDVGAVARIHTFRYFLEDIAAQPVSVAVTGSTGTGTIAQHRPPRFYVVRGLRVFTLTASGGSNIWQQSSQSEESTPDSLGQGLSTFLRA
jgi:hypothetical protein